MQRCDHRGDTIGLGGVAESFAAAGIRVRLYDETPELSREVHGRWRSAPGSTQKRD